MTYTQCEHACRRLDRQWFFFGLPALLLQIVVGFRTSDKRYFLLLNLLARQFGLPFHSTKSI